MKLDTSDKSLPVYEALASDVRLKMINLLSKQEMNVKQLAEALGLSSAIMTMHVKKLERAGLIESKMVPGRGGAKKVCKLVTESIEITFPSKTACKPRLVHEVDVSVGHYTDIHAEPTCGLATTEKIIGIFDEPRCFLDPDRVHAKILWFGKGYVEYKVPNYLMRSEEPQALEVSFEISSEAPSVNEDWPSDISFYLNGVLLGSWTSPGDFGGTSVRGKYTPEWWLAEVNHYGLLKVLKINHKGTFIDGNRISDVTIDQVDIRNKQLAFRFAVLDDAKNVGGMTLFGTGFGNYNQDINFRLYYTKSQAPASE